MGPVHGTGPLQLWKTKGPSALAPPPKYGEFYFKYLFHFTKNV